MDKILINKTIDSLIEDVKCDGTLTTTIRGLDIQELKKLDAVLHRDEQIQTPSSIKASDLSNNAVNLYAAMVSKVYTMTVRSCEGLYSNAELDKLTQGYKEFAEDIFQANGDKTKKFDATRKAMSLLRNTASQKNIEKERVFKK